MNYALLNGTTVSNIIFLNPNNADDFPGAVSTEDKPVQMGDTYEDGKFWRDGVEVVIPPEPEPIEPTEPVDIYAEYEDAVTALETLGYTEEEENGEV